MVIYIENAGDFVVPLSTVKEVHSGNAMLDHTQLDVGIRDAIRHVRDAENPNNASISPKRGQLDTTHCHLVHSNDLDPPPEC